MKPSRRVIALFVAVFVLAGNGLVLGTALADEGVVVYCFDDEEELCDTGTCEPPSGSCDIGEIEAGNCDEPDDADCIWIMPPGSTYCGHSEYPCEGEIEN